MTGPVEPPVALSTDMAVPPPAYSRFDIDPNHDAQAVAYLYRMALNEVLRDLTRRGVMVTKGRLTFRSDGRQGWVSWHAYKRGGKQ